VLLESLRQLTNTIINVTNGLWITDTERIEYLMAIRAGELGIPAVIGVGEKLFNLWKKAQTMHIDCANKKVEILR
jgi:D-aminopeptidase